MLQTFQYTDPSRNFLKKKPHDYHCYKQQFAYLSLPTFSEEHWKATEDSSEKADYSNVLPETATLEKMVNRYYKIIFENLTDVTGEKGFYTRGDGVQEEAYVLTVRVTEKQLHDIFSALVAEAKADAELKKLMRT